MYQATYRREHDNQSRTNGERPNIPVEVQEAATRLQELCDEHDLCFIIALDDSVDVGGGATRNRTTANRKSNGPAYERMMIEILKSARGQSPQIDALLQMMGV